MELFLPKFILNVTILILEFTVSHVFDCDVPRSTSYGVYIRFPRASSHVADFNTQIKLLTS